MHRFLSFQEHYTKVVLGIILVSNNRAPIIGLVISADAVPCVNAEPAVAPVHELLDEKSHISSSMYFSYSLSILLLCFISSSASLENSLPISLSPNLSERFI